MGGTHRFSELRRKVGGVSEKMLAQTLQCLEKDGFVKRVSLPVVPPHVEYTLTSMGEEVSHKVESLADWIEENTSRILKKVQGDGGETAKAADWPPFELRMLSLVFPDIF